MRNSQRVGPRGEAWTIRFIVSIRTVPTQPRDRSLGRFLGFLATSYEILVFSRTPGWVEGLAVKYPRPRTPRVAPLSATASWVPSSRTRVPTRTQTQLYEHAFSPLIIHLTHHTSPSEVRVACAGRAMQLGPRSLPRVHPLWLATLGQASAVHVQLRAHLAGAQGW